MIGQSPFSESFQIIGGTFFRGTFDESTRIESEDNAGVGKNVIDSRIIVPTLPGGLACHNGTESCFDSHTLTETSF